MTDTQIGGNFFEFPSTHWGLVRLAARETVAMDAVIRIYWKPLYFFVRQKGFDNETAKDITQEFLTVLLERRAVAKADPERGKFRTLLLVSLENFLKDRNKEAGRQKRGGGRPILSLDFGQGEKEYSVSAASSEPPESMVGRAWARALFTECVGELEGNPAHVEALKLHLAGADYETISERTGLSVAAARTAIHRLQGRFREILSRHLASTAVNPDEVDLEIREFISLLR
jgi:RNA polymerase sigma-70 factor (ECF subfamily)